MTLEDFVSAEGDVFRIDSEYMIIADPFYLGLRKNPLWTLIDTFPASQEFLDKEGIVGGVIRVMPHGVILETGYETDWHVYKEDSALLLIPEIGDDEEKEINQREGTSLLTALADTCKLLVGDANKFVIAQEKRVSLYDYTEPPFNSTWWDEGTGKVLVNHDLEEIESASKQILKASPGEYMARFYNNPIRVFINNVH